MKNKFLEDKLSEWRGLCKKFSKHPKFNFTVLGEDIISIAPKRYEKHFGSKDFDCMFLAIVHGVEVAGIEVQIRVMQDLFHGVIDLSKHIVFALGNVSAFLQSKRYLQRDLNRSFDSSISGGSAEFEIVRAKELAYFIQRSDALIDLHQTRLKVATPFFIFPLDWQSLRYVAQLEMDFPVVTHWKGSFSKDGLCSDEYAHRYGSIGFTLELGQNGFDETSIQAGVDALRKAIDRRQFPNDFAQQYSLLETLKIYTWHSIIMNDDPNKRLVEGLYNFKSLQPGQLLVPKYSGNDPLYSPKESDISVLFPQYPDAQAKVQAAELIRLIKVVSLQDIPGFDLQV